MSEGQFYKFNSMRLFQHIYITSDSQFSYLSSTALKPKFKVCAHRKLTLYSTIDMTYTSSEEKKKLKSLQG